MTDKTLPPPDPAMLNLLLERVPLRVAVLDREHRYLWANQEAIDFLGVPVEKIIGATIAEVRGTAVFERYLPISDRLFGGEEMHWEGWTEYAGRGRRYTDEWLVPYIPPGSPPGTLAELVFGFVRDLTDTQLQSRQLGEREQALQLAEHLKSAIVDNALSAIVTSDAQGHIVEFNPAAERTFGMPRERALGRTVAEVMVPPRHRAGHDGGMRRMAQGGDPHIMGQRVEMHALRADGSEFPVEMVLWKTGVAGNAYYTASISDVSERVRADALIERQRDALRQSEKLTAMGSLLAGVAHELNNPLSIVMGRASLLEEKAAATTWAGGSELAAEARSIRDAAERCGRIVRSFLNMARSRPPQRSAVSLNELAGAATEMLQYSLRSHDIELQQQLDAELPAINADADQIGQIVLNLIVNAQQALTGVAAFQGRRLIVLSTGVDIPRDNDERRAAPRLWLRVADSGPGVPPALRASIFDPFFTTKAEGLGTGLGLAVSRSLAREHGGTLSLEDSASGATFCLSLPLGDVAVAPVAEAQAEGQGAEISARVLVVDDEAEIADLMRDFLEGAGYEVATAESGAVALEMLKEVRFDVIVSDLRMPDIDGAALWREVRERWPELARRMLFVTGDTLSRGADSFLAETGCPSLEKPFSRKALLERVKGLLQA